MIRSRVSTMIAALTLIVLTGGPAWASDPAYPPAPDTTGTVVGEVGSGAATRDLGPDLGPEFGGLPQTGADLTYLVVGALVLLLGVALLVVSRRRAH